VHQLVNKNFDNIKMHGTYVKTIVSYIFYFRNIYFGKLAYIPSEIPKFIFFHEDSFTFLLLAIAQ